MERKKYYLYIDECGDQNLSNFDANFPIFTLCGIIVSESMRDKLDSQILELKKTFWGERKIILHSRDIRKCQNGFEILFDLNVKGQFYTKINEILGQKGVYTVVCCSILKEPYIKRFTIRIYNKRSRRENSRRLCNRGIMIKKLEMNN